LLVFVSNPTVDLCENAELTICPAYFGKQGVRSVFDVRAKTYLNAPEGKWCVDMPNQTYQIYEITLA